MTLYWHYGMVRLSSLSKEAPLATWKEPMSESQVSFCRACGVSKVGTDPWGQTYCYACGEGWKAQIGTEGKNPGSSEALAGGGDEPEDLVQTPEGKTWKVYGLIDPRNRDFLYVGITQNLFRRLSQHRSSKQSAVYDRIQAIEADGPRVEYCVFGIFPDLESAAFLEKNLVVCLPQIYNETYFNEGAELWKRYREKKNANQ